MSETELQIHTVWGEQPFPQRSAGERPSGEGTAWESAGRVCRMKANQKQFPNRAEAQDVL